MLAYAYLNEEELAVFRPTLVITDKENRIVASKPYIFEQIES